MDSNGQRLSGSRRSGNDHRLMIIKHNSGNSSNLSSVIHEKKLLKEAEEEERGKKTLGLAEDCSSCIFLWLPIDALQRSSCVCKPWKSIIRNPSFIESHLRQSETVLLCLSYTDPNEQSGQTSTSSVPINKAKTFSVESSLLPQRESIFPQELPRTCMRQNYLYFLEIKDGNSIADMKSFNVCCSGAVLASCNGLILLRNKLKNGGLVVMNPVSRKLTALPAGTIVPLSKESYGFAFKSSTKEHIVVHLFREDSGYVSCEILTIEKKKWTMVKGPPSGLITSLDYKPVFANAALHWLHGVTHNNCLLSMVVEEEKFCTIPLPKAKGFHDGIIEMGGFLCFVTHELQQIGIWALKDLSKESWTKQHTIGTSVLLDMTPLCGSRHGRWMVLTSYSVYQVEDEVEGVDEDGIVQVGEGIDTAVEGQAEVGQEVNSLYVYDFHVRVMSKLRTKHLPPAFHAYLPHVNSLLWC